MSLPKVEPKFTTITQCHVCPTYARMCYRCGLVCQLVGYSADFDAYLCPNDEHMLREENLACVSKS